MKIGVLGTGDVGRALASGLIGLGHDVKIGSRTPESDTLKDWKSKNGVHASTGSPADAATFGELVILATLWSGTENAIKLAGPDNFKGKVVIDCTNPLMYAENAPPSLALGWNDSGGEQVQRWLPGARVVKTFNTVGNQHMVKPDFPGGPPDMFICGDDAAAKEAVAGIVRAFGWIADDVGGIEGARVLEPMCILWVLYGIHNGAWDHAFKMLRK